LVDADYRAIDVSIFETLNSIRENPRSFVPFLTSMKDYFDSSGLIYKEDGRVPI
jgi:hypothetical protein